MTLHSPTIRTEDDGSLRTSSALLAFEAAVDDPTISQEAVGDLVGKLLSFLGQDNNSATLKAGDLQLAGGINEGAGPDGDTILGTGIAQLEVDNDLPGIGVFENAPVGQQTVTGARNTEAAQASHYTAMEAFGWIVDSTTIQTAAQVITPSATPALDFATNRLNVITLDQNSAFTIAAPPNIGDVLHVRMIQDGTGTWTVSWPAGVVWQSGTEPSWTTTAADENHAFLHWLGGTDYVAWGLIDVS